MAVNRKSREYVICPCRNVTRGEVEDIIREKKLFDIKEVIEAANVGNARGALVLSTARQGSCFLPILYPLAWIFGAYGVGCVQAVADVLTMVLALPILKGINKKLQNAMEAAE